VMSKSSIKQSFSCGVVAMIWYPFFFLKCLRKL
jgi:hypothetical protein